MDKRFRVFDRHLAKAMLYILDSYIELFNLPIDKSKSRKLFKKWGIEVDASIDEGLEKINVAKNSLSEALEAIEDIETRAQENKKEAEAALEKLKELEENKSHAEQELAEIRKIASNDIEVFRKLGGIPGPDDKKRERYIGFASGVAASLIASGIFWALSAFF